jgi:menaquinone-9 beta-reductase
VLSYDAIVVGGGPAGSSCAGALGRAGLSVVVVDGAAFPRDKVCAGWVTPDVFRLLALSPEEYRASGGTLQEIRGFRTGAFGQAPLETRYDGVVSHAIRRCEFDAFLLARAGVRVQQRHVASLRRAGGRWIVDDALSAPIVIGAGGHFCPVAHHLRGGRDTTPPIVAREAEFAVPAAADVAAPPTLYFCRDLAGYAWYIHKGGWVNVGIGRRSAQGFASHAAAFTALLARDPALAGIASVRWKGHAYLASGAGARPLVGEGLLTIGDAAGLAYPESGEGIRPAIESGLAAAAAVIEAGGRTGRDVFESYADRMRQRHPPFHPRPAAVNRAVAPAARLLLRSRAFTRHVLLDRWFLRVGDSATATGARPD